MGFTRIICPSCNKALKLGGAVPAGKAIRCPLCRNVFKPPAMVDPEIAEEDDKGPDQEPSPPPKKKAPQPKRASGLKPASRRKGVIFDDPGGESEDEEFEPPRPRRVAGETDKRKIDPAILWSSVAGGVGLVLALILYLIATSGGGSESNAPHSSKDVPRENRDKKEEGKDIRDAAPAHSLTMKQLAEELKADRKATVAKYQGKVIELNGDVDNLGYVDGNLAVFLKGQGNDKFPCYTRESVPGFKVTPGLSVRLIGRWGMSPTGGGCLQDALILDIRGDPAPAYTPDQLVQAFEAEPEVMKKRIGRYGAIRITGEIASVPKTSKFGGIEFHLKSTGTTRVQCEFDPRHTDLAKGLQVGQRVVLLGYFARFVKGDSISLISCLPMEPAK
jgi:hypothetical protein